MDRIAAAGWVVVIASTCALGQQTTKLSKSVTGTSSHGLSEEPSLSRDGRFASFASTAPDLVASDLNGLKDVFVIDRQTLAMERASVSTAGIEGDGASQHAMLAGDGSAVAFDSAAKNLVAAGLDNNQLDDVYVRDLATGQMTLVSRTALGTSGNKSSRNPWISGSGRYVAFESEASNLVAGDLLGFTDVFLLDRQTGTITRESVSSAGLEANANSIYPAVSDDGRFIAFVSAATTLGAPAGNVPQVFLRDRLAGTTTLISKDSGGFAASAWCADVCISADAGVVAFRSMATNFVPDSNTVPDVFVWHAATGLVSRESVSSTNAQLAHISFAPALSADGRCLGFSTLSPSVSDEDQGLHRDVFMRDLELQKNWLVSIPAAAGKWSDGESDLVAFNGDGSEAAFISDASTMVGVPVPGTIQVYARGFQHPLQPTLGYRHGASMLAIGGAPLATGNAATMTLFHAPADQPSLVLIGLGNQPTFTPKLNAPLVTIPLALVLTGATDAKGVLFVPFTGGTGPTTLTVQCATSGLNVPGYPYDLSNAVEVHLLP